MNAAEAGRAALALGVVRAGVSLVFLVSVLISDFSVLAHLPATLARPAGFMWVVSWGFYELLLTRTGMIALQFLLVLSLALSAIGYLAPVTTKSSAVLVSSTRGCCAVSCTSK